MQKRRLLIIFAVLGLSLIVNIVAQAQGPEFDEFIYLPLIYKAPSNVNICTQHEPNDESTQATPISNGQVLASCIIPETDIDWLKFSVGVKSQVVIQLSGVTERGDVYVTLYDSNLNSLETGLGFDSDFIVSASIERECGKNSDALSPGTYYISVEEWFNLWEISRYDITLAVAPCPTISVLENHTTYIYGDDLVVVGEVQNDGVTGVKGIDLVVNLFNGNNQLIDTTTATVPLSPYSWYSALAAGEKTCFTAYFDQTTGWAYYQFEVPTYSNLDSPLRNMAVYGDSGTYMPEEKDCRVLGFVRNGNQKQVSNVSVVITLYGLTGNVVDCGSAPANNDVLAPSQSTSFEREFSNRDDYEVDSYRIQVGGDLLTD